jgi:hypothetical protein
MKGNDKTIADVEDTKVLIIFLCKLQKVHKIIFSQFSRFLLIPTKLQIPLNGSSQFKKM